MQREADVKAESVARKMGDTEEKISELEAKNGVLKSKLEEEKRSKVELERKVVELQADRDEMAHEASEWQEVAVTTKQECEEKLHELNGRLSMMSADNADSSD